MEFDCTTAYEFVTEYSFYFETYPGHGPIRARIRKDLGTGRYWWETSHYYRQQDQGDVYRPSLPMGETLETCKTNLNRYLKGFKDAVYLEANLDYNPPLESKGDNEQ